MPGSCLFLNRVRYIFKVVVVLTPGADLRVEGFKEEVQEADGGEAAHVH